MSHPVSIPLQQTPVISAMERRRSAEWNFTEGKHLIRDGLKGQPGRADPATVVLNSQAAHGGIKSNGRWSESWVRQQASRIWIARLRDVHGPLNYASSCVRSNDDALPNHQHNPIP